MLFVDIWKILDLMSDKTKIATIIVNRNLPNETNKLCRNIKKYNNTDIYVIESGSNKKLSRYSTWHVRDKSSVKMV